MTKRRAIITWAFLAGIAISIAAGGAVWIVGYGRALEQVHARANSDLALASDRLVAQLQKYKELAVLLSNHPDLVRLSRDIPIPAAVEQANLMLRRTADKTGAIGLIYTDRNGAILASSSQVIPKGIVQSGYFKRALTGALGIDHRYDPDLEKRVFYYAAPYFGNSGKVAATLIVVVDVERIEAQWRGTRPTVFFIDTKGEVFISNRSELLGWQRDTREIGLHPPFAKKPQFSAELMADGHEIWTLNWGPYVPRVALHIADDLPTIDLRAEALVDLAPARRLAFLQSLFVGVLVLFFAMILGVVLLRRYALAQENMILDRRVRERTQELSHANENLRHEISERKEAEAALKQAQDDLVQAGKLTALAQLSAGVSHELNQPLMAIQQYATNAQAFLEKKNVKTVASNLAQIAALSQRMGRIIRNLRAFARNEHEAMGKVDVVAVVDAALELLSARFDREGVLVDWQRPNMPIFVIAGEVRLGQVMVNLLSNALDAMDQSDPKTIQIGLQTEAHIRLWVSDSGPGISEPEKIFEPFYTTKAVGQGDGMGLGLSISYGLIQSFGGDIRGENTGQGAKFTVDLKPWQDQN